MQAQLQDQQPLTIRACEDWEREVLQPYHAKLYPSMPMGDFLAMCKSGSITGAPEGLRSVSLIYRRLFRDAERVRELVESAQNAIRDSQILGENTVTVQRASWDRFKNIALNWERI